MPYKVPKEIQERLDEHRNTSLSDDAALLRTLAESAVERSQPNLAATLLSAAGSITKQAALMDQQAGVTASLSDVAKVLAWMVDQVIDALSTELDQEGVNRVVDRMEEAVQKQFAQKRLEAPK